MREVIEFTPSQEYTSRQSFYMLPGRAGLFPNRTFVLGGMVLFDTNRLGLKGSDPDPTLKQAVIWGDSVVFAHERGWVYGLNGAIPGWQFHNGGIEGDPLDNILDRAAAMQGRLKIDANILFPGWHPSFEGRPVNSQVETWLEERLDRLPNPILATIPTALNEKVVEQEITPFLGASPWGPFSLWGRMEPTVESLQTFYRRLLERNDIIRAVAARKGVPLFDWFAAMPSTAVEDFRADFSDVGHPRITAYPKIARLWAGALPDLLPPTREGASA
ncbi:SGNH/GDSL hydrolase family protein [Azospirillum sp. RWY-5-1]|uniref:SGNH/GDSL hydrolase family protein n=1 Tax=Azospirillum oleiclasticum TaxID=2735135 RepID=A0ABX2TL71_9PROT|nr:SGNH/GDSL hydrolase family protein [Azospirillum oleiclasticum]NYZ17915.1 SGNH/GDSL hydrolase family protein [Azospirillum oleiclasticum]NYZ25110.1 SGNH/GDSL hydrolase family protein [Azospirillum oleiclasticum]